MRGKEERGLVGRSPEERYIKNSVETYVPKIVVNDVLKVHVL